MRETMSPARLVARELNAAVRTKKLLALCITTAALAGLSVIMAIYANDILTYALGSELGTAIRAEDLPEPTAATVWQQWTNNLIQTLALILGVIVAYETNRNVYSPAGHLMLTRPVRRSSVLFANLAANVSLTVAAAAVGLAVVVCGTAALFDDANVSAVLGGTALWVTCAVFIAAFGQLFGVVIRSRVGAIGATVGLYFVLLTLGTIPILSETTPAGLFVLPTTVAGGESAAGELALPLATGFGASVIAVTVAARVFERRDL